MSEPYFARLPRFDANADDAHPHLAEDIAPLAPPPRVLIEPEIVPATETNEDLRECLAELGAARASLAEAVRKEAMRLAAELMDQLFPELSRQFLADEFMRQLPAMLPQSEPALRLIVPDALAAKFETELQRSPALAARISVVASTSQAPAAIDVSWMQGGLSFDFEAFYRALRAERFASRLSALEPT